MPDPNATPTPAPAPTPAPPDIPPQAGPDLSGLIQPGPAAQPNVQTAAMGSFEEATAKEAAAYQKASELAQPAPPPPEKHATLMRMVEGLSRGLVGLGAAGTAIATHGREGGVQEVEQIQSEEQRRRLEAQAAAQAQKNAQIQQQITIGQTNHQLAQNYLLLMTMPDEITASHLKVEAGKASLAGMQAEFQSTYGLTPEQFTGMMSGTAAPDQKTIQNLRTFSQQKVDAAAAILPKDDPYLQNAQQVLSDPNASPNAIFGAVSSVNRQVSLQGQVMELRTKQEAAAVNAPLGDKADAINAAMLDRYKVMNPGATALPDAYKMSPSSTPKDFDRIDKILQQTETAAATKTQRDTINEMRRQTLALSGMGAPAGDVTLTGDAYLESLPAAERSLVKSIGTGKAAPDRLAYLLSRNPKLTQELTLAYPDWDSSKAASYAVTYKDFTSGKTSVALNSGATAAKHLAELKKINDENPVESRTPGTAAYKAFYNKLNTVAGELVKFYGMPDTDKSIKAMTGTLGGFTSRDAAIIEQGKSMSDKFQSFGQTWKNAAPSAAYQAPLPGVDADAIAAMRILDPDFDRKNSDLAQLGGARTVAAARTRPAGVSPQAVLMQTPGGKPHWIEPANISQARALGATEVQ